MNLLWAFEFSPAKDRSGKEVVPDIWNFAQVRRCLVLSLSPSPLTYHPGIGELTKPFPMHCQAPQC